MAGWSFNGNAALFCVCASVAAISVYSGWYGAAVFFGAIVVATCTDQICLVIKQQGKDSEHQS